MVDSTYYLDKNMPDRYMHNIYLYGPGQFAQVVSRWNRKLSGSHPFGTGRLGSYLPARWATWLWFSGYLLWTWSF